MDKKTRNLRRAWREQMGLSEKSKLPPFPVDKVESDQWKLALENLEEVHGNIDVLQFTPFSNQLSRTSEYLEVGLLGYQKAVEMGLNIPSVFPELFLRRK